MSPRWKTILWALAGTTMAIAAALIIASILISRDSRAWMQEWLSGQYDSDVELSSFGVAIPFPLVQVEAGDVTLYFKGRKDLPPLIAIKHLTMRTSMWGLLRRSRRISYVRLEGLQINIPPREDHVGGNAKAAMRKIRTVRFDEILTENATLTILTTKPGKSPLQFDLQQLHLNSYGTDGALAFHTVLSNAVPPGQIVSSGVFGPWNAGIPSQTPVSGNFTFDNANLGVFKGIAGTLSAKGSYEGELDRIHTDGTTDTPDFQVTLAGHPVDLTTTFHATVDGTDGDTSLEPVMAHFGQTDLLAQGSVERDPAKKGKTVTLDVTSSQARIQDLLLLALKESPPMDGPIRLHTKFILAPGPKPIPDRIYLDGSFDLASMHFASSAVQQKVDNMSKRSEGKPKEVVNPADAIKTDDVAGAMKGNFRVENGILTLAGLNFSIPGADVNLAGDYFLDNETLALHGNLKMQAKLSETTTGFKSFLLKLADPFFSKHGNGANVPIKITGSAQHPHYGLDLGHKNNASAENR